MDSMDLYPAGFAPAGLPISSMQPSLAALEPSLQQAMHTKQAARVVLAAMPTEAAGEEDDTALSNTDMEMLERLLRGCHLVDDDAAACAPSSSSATPSAPSFLAPSHSAMSALPTVGDFGARAAVEPWAGEMVQRLQGSPSIAEANARCTEMLLTFQQQQSSISGNGTGQDANRLRTLQGANRVLLRGFKNLYKRQSQMQAERQTAEARFATMAAELARTQAALQASERSNGALQYHLQLMSHTPGIVAGGGI